MKVIWIKQHSDPSVHRSENELRGINGSYVLGCFLSDWVIWSLVLLNVLGAKETLATQLRALHERVSGGVFGTIVEVSVIWYYYRRKGMARPVGWCKILSRYAHRLLENVLFNLICSLFYRFQVRSNLSSAKYLKRRCSINCLTFSRLITDNELSSLQYWNSYWNYLWWIHCVCMMATMVLLRLNVGFVQELLLVNIHNKKECLLCGQMPQWVFTVTFSFLLGLLS